MNVVRSDVYWGELYPNPPITSHLTYGRRSVPSDEPIDLDQL